MLRYWMVAATAAVLLGGFGYNDGGRLVSSLPGLVYSEPAQTVVRRLSADFQPTQVKLLAEYDGPSEPHAYIYRDRDMFCIAFNDVDSGSVTVAPPARDDLISTWQIDHPTFRRAIWCCRLRYPVPGDNFTIHSDKGRLEVDILRHYESESTLKLTRGVEWTQGNVSLGGHYLAVNQLQVNLKDKAVKLDIGLAHDNAKSVEAPSALVARKGALAGVNGGFFEHNQGPLGLVVVDGQIVVPPVSFRPPRTALGITSEGKVVMDQVKVEDGKLVSLHGTDWTKVVDALGGGPRLIKDGQIGITEEEEGLGGNGNNITYRAARTAVGTLPDHRLVIVTMRGSMEGDHGGALLLELAQYMQSLNVKDAMCLDGGGSTAMAISGTLVDHAQGTQEERPVSDALLVYDNGKTEFPSRVQLRVDKSVLPADGKSTLEAEALVYTGTNVPVPDGTEVEFRNSLGQPVGRVKSLHGSARITVAAAPVTGVTALSATCGSGRDTAFVHFFAGAPARLYARGSLAGQPPPTVTPSPTLSPSAAAPLQLLMASASAEQVAQIMPDGPTPFGSPTDVESESPSPSPTEVETPPIGTPSASPSAVPSPTYAPRYLVDVLVTDALGNPLVGEAVTAQWAEASGLQRITRATDALGIITIEVDPSPRGTPLDVSHASIPPLHMTLPGWHY